jgi:hypothetical protein
MLVTDNISKRFVKALEDKMSRLLSTHNESDVNTGVVDVNSHEIFEAFIMMEGAKELRIDLELTRADSSLRLFFEGLIGEEKELEYVSHSQVSMSLRLDFPRFGWMLDSAMRGQIEASRELPVRIPEQIRPVYTTILMIHLQMLEEPTIFTCLDAIRNLGRNNWEPLIRQVPSPQEIAAAADSSEQSSMAVYHGFLAMASAFARINSIFGPVETSEEEADLTIVREYVRSAIDWRFDTKTAQSSTRIEQLRDHIVDSAIKEVPYGQRSRLRSILEKQLNESIGLVYA